MYINYDSLTYFRVSKRCAVTGYMGVSRVVCCCEAITLFLISTINSIILEVFVLFSLTKILLNTKALQLLISFFILKNIKSRKAKHCQSQLTLQHFFKFWICYMFLLFSTSYNWAWDLCDNGCDWRSIVKTAY